MLTKEKWNLSGFHFLFQVMQLYLLLIVIFHLYQEKGVAGY